MQRRLAAILAADVVVTAELMKRSTIFQMLIEGDTHVSTKSSRSHCCQSEPGAFS
jgi:hypothetical protein